MHLLDAPAARNELASQPIEQVEMRRAPTLQAKIARCRNDAPPEVMLPDAVDHHSRGQRIVGAGNPFSECSTPIRSMAVLSGNGRCGRTCCGRKHPCS